MKEPTWLSDKRISNYKLGWSERGCRFCVLCIRPTLYDDVNITVRYIYFLCMLIERRKCEDYITWRGFFLRRLYIDVRYPARRRKLIKHYTHLHVSAICDLIGVWSAEERGTKIRTGNFIFNETSIIRIRCDQRL